MPKSQCDAQTGEERCSYAYLASGPRSREHTRLQPVGESSTGELSQNGKGRRTSLTTFRPEVRVLTWDVGDPLLNTPLHHMGRRDLNVGLPFLR